LGKVIEIGRRYDLPIGNVFHAGDGNFHPLILFDERNAADLARAEKAAAEILEACVAAGGTVTGEHGIGAEKIHAMGLIFSDQDLSAMRNAKAVFDPGGTLNPEKVLPEAKEAAAT
jgi:glycolate oxidase